MVWMDAVVESGRNERNPRVSTRFSLGVENERAGARMVRSNLSHETKFSGANGDKESIIFPVQLTMSRIGKRSG